ncbi:hypothetical protein Tco_0444436 [Tanacetum coccineum]
MVKTQQCDLDGVMEIECKILRIVLVGEDVETFEDVVEDEPQFITMGKELFDSNGGRCGSNGGRGGSMTERGGGWLAKHSIVSNEGCGGGGLAVYGGRSSSE